MNYICADCSHITDSIAGLCRWCLSGDIRLYTPYYRMRHKQRVQRPQVDEPDVYQQIHYHPKFRLMKGFSILHGGSI